jgi:hypothetical protein
VHAVERTIDDGGEQPRTKSLQSHASDGGIFVNTTRSCSLAFNLS